MPRETSRDSNLAEFMRLATLLDMSVCRASMWRKELAHQIAGKMVNRVAAFVYQSISLNLVNFPESVVRSALPAENLESGSTPSCLTWRLETEQEVTEIMGPLLSDSKYMVAGGSRGLKTASEKYIRVIARLMSPVEVSLVEAARGVVQLYVNANYCLLGETGEMYPPKDNERRELPVALSANQVRDIRQAVHADALRLGELGYPLSPEWWRRLGMEDRALQVEQESRALALQPKGRWKLKLGSRGGKPKQRRRRTPNRPLQKWEVECIVAEKQTTGKTDCWYLVRWAGYDPSWEKWRCLGQVGDPIETWEPLSSVQHTEALQRFQSRPSSAGASQ